jgi:hypothetical protein
MIQKQIPDMRLAAYSSGGKPYAIVAIDVAPEGLAFIRSEMLDHGPLSRRVAELFGSGGVTFAPMFEGTTSDYAKKFTYDGPGKWCAHKWIAEYAISQWDKDCQIIIEEPWQSMSDIAQSGPTARFFGSENFPYFTSETGDLFKDLEDAAGETTFKRFGFIVSPPVPLPPNGATADPQTIEALAQNTKMALLSAYDDMGYVIWMK